MAAAPATLALIAENDRLQANWKKAREASKEATKKLMASAIAAGSAYGVSWMQGRYPEKAKVFGVDIELAAGAACLAAGTFGLAGKQSEYVEAAGVGAIAAFSAKKGSEAGAKAKAAAK